MRISVFYQFLSEMIHCRICTVKILVRKVFIGKHRIRYSRALVLQIKITFFQPLKE